MGWFAAPNFRMNEFSGGVLLAQLRKLDAIVNAVRRNARRVYEGIRDLPGVHLRHLPDPEGELGAAIFLGFKTKEQRDSYISAMKAENVPAHPPGGSVILPILPHIEKKVTVHPAWPSFTSERGKAIGYGSGCCPRTIDTLNRFAGVSLEGSTLRQDNKANEQLYGRKITARDIVRGGKGGKGQQLVSLLQKASPKNESDPSSLK